MSAAYGLAQLGEAQGVTGLMQLFDEAEQDSRGRFVALRALTSLNDTLRSPGEAPELRLAHSWPRVHLQ